VSAVAERLRDEQRRRLRAMTAAERVRETLALGQRDLDAYASAHGLSHGEARRHLEAAADPQALRSEIEAGVSRLAAESRRLWQRISGSA
jgi:hypothetical protein